MRLRRLEIRQFRGVVPGTVLEFADGVNVVLGQNGTGKTTLLELVSMIVRSDFSSLRDETFDLGFTMELGDGVVVRMALEGRPASAEGLDEQALLALLRGGADAAPPGRWRYEVTVSRPGQPVVVVEVQDGEARGSSPEVVGSVSADLFESGLLTRFALRFFDGFYESVPSGRGRFDEALGGFHDLVSPKFPNLLVIRLKGESHVLSALPEGLTHRVEQHLTRTDTLDTLRLGREDAPVLARLCDVLGIVDLSLHPRLDGPSPLAGLASVRYRGFDLIATLDRRDPPTRVPHDRLSFGQKRMIAFFWHLACDRSGVVVADELVNGLHHAWVAECLDEIGDRQAFIASQNPLLLDFLDFDTADEVRRTFILCSVAPSADGGRTWDWRNLTEDEAQSFFRAFEVGIQHVSDILRTKGLW